MKTLKSVLEQDYSKKTKKELIEMLTGLETALTPSVYEQVNGIAPSELQNFTKKDILDIIDSFKTGYDPQWENSFARISSDTIKLIFGQMAADDDFFRTADASGANFVAELGSIDFAKIIGGPLDACVKAQTNASVSTVSFINEVGFETVDETTGEKKLRMVEFKYKRKAPNPDYVNEDETPDEEPFTEQDVELSVPFIALLNVPSFRIDSCEIDFNVKLKSTYTRKVDDEFGIKTSTSGGTGGFASLFAKVNFSVDVSYKRSTSTGVKIEKEYSLGVKVRATNDEMPAGLEKVLGILSQ
ncbi:DUF2589 domain-containing protein [Proteiniphilum sp.]|uniref:DUF2589 domain-containing protein n=1 Tax=Proteiniphilum sp. TaxID=1926877 RepID=UPI00332EBF52